LRDPLPAGRSFRPLKLDDFICEGVACRVDLPVPGTGDPFAAAHHRVAAVDNPL
jgi:hypothetical protein